MRANKIQWHCRVDTTYPTSEVYVVYGFGVWYGVKQWHRTLNVKSMIVFSDSSLHPIVQVITVPLEYIFFLFSPSKCSSCYGHLPCLNNKTLFVQLSASDLKYFKDCPWMAKCFLFWMTLWNTKPNKVSILKGNQSWDSNNILILIVFLLVLYVVSLLQD